MQCVVCVACYQCRGLNFNCECCVLSAWVILHPANLILVLVYFLWLDEMSAVYCIDSFIMYNNPIAAIDVINFMKCQWNRSICYLGFVNVFEVDKFENKILNCFPELV